MAISVMITRRFKKEFIHEAHNYNAKMRALATVQPGYIGGKSMASLEDPNKVVVISTWEERSDWENWRQNDLRKDYYKKMRAALEVPEELELYTESVKR